MKEIRIGIIGSGFMGRTNAETITKYLDGAEARADHRRQPGRGTGVREYNAQHDRVRRIDLLSRDDIDAVFISTPTLRMPNTPHWRATTASTSCSISPWPQASRSARDHRSRTRTGAT